MNRRRLLAAAGFGTAALSCSSSKTTASAKAAAGPPVEELDKAASQPVLKLDGITSPVVIESIKLLKKDKEFFVHVRSKDGAEGLSLPNPPRPEYLAKILQDLIVPFFIGKDARDLENLLWELYRYKDNYKLYGIALWSPHAWVEFAILDMLGRIAKKPMGALFGDVRRKEIPIYTASGRRDTTPEQEIEHLKKLVAESGSKALKFRVGGRMSRNADAMPGRTETLIPLVRKTFGDDFDIHADSNSSYDPPQAIKVGRMLEDIKAVYFEEPCPFDHLEDTKVVADTLTIPVAGGEQEYSDWRFRWMIANRAVDIVQPDLHYYGGMVRSMRVAKMADVANMPTTVHISGGFGYVYMLHFASVIRDPGKYQEYKLGQEKYAQWFEPAITVKDGKMSVPAGPGVGIKDIAAVIKGAKEV
ncbi:MAG: mandelate racemase/muconate lactonizing enzyme family protein [Bryobacterales bacterium]|nr:mandelate racemase/muconate lactonizing enzyme family protein [Bryobacterales bacterium]